MLRLPGMTISLPKEVAVVISMMQQAKFEIYIVGGSVRDILAHRPVKDWDFTTSALPDQIMAVFPEAFYENTFGTVSVAGKHLYAQLQDDPEKYAPEMQKSVYEITTFRSEGAYTDHRRPDEVVWGETLEQDLQRRDFTLNAIALQITLSSDQIDQLQHHFSLALENIHCEGKLIDPYQGEKDLQHGILQAVGDPQQRFEEDALRMLRAVRLSAQLKLAIEPETLMAIQLKADLIAHVSWERIRDEILKIIVTDQIEDAFSIMATTGLLHHILPELLDARGIEQRGHHEYDVWNHLLRATQLCPSTDPVVKFAALLHDISKPQTQSPLPDKEGEFSFYNHEVIGARVARDIARRFRLPKEDIQRVFTLVRWHMFYYQTDMTDSAIRRFMRRVGLENLDDIMALREGDRLGSGSKRTSWRLEEMKQRIQDQLHQPMKVSDLAIDGHDVMETLQIPPGKKIGEILNVLFEEVLENPELNVRETLLAKLSGFVSND